MKRLIQLVAGLLLVVAGVLIGSFAGRIVAAFVLAHLIIFTLGTIFVNMSKEAAEAWDRIPPVLGGGCGGLVAAIIVWIALGLKPLPRGEAAGHD